VSKVTVTTTQEASISPKVQRKLLTELRGYGAIATEMKGLKDAKEGHSAAVLALSLEGVDGDKYELEGYKVAVVKGAKDRRFDKDKLVKRLVKDGKYTLKAAMALVEDCTTDKPKKDHVRITVPGEESDE
jgi:hypothetical protein